MRGAYKTRYARQKSKYGGEDATALGVRGKEKRES